MEAVTIRPATPEDAPALLAIYAPYVRETAITFEYEVPSLEEFAGRIRRTLERYPYLAAQSGDEVLGYACAGAFKERAAYDWSVETTIYLRQDQRGHGLGRALYQALERCLAAQHIQNLNACIADPAQAGDPYLTGASAAFHARLGYQLVGRFHKCGYKFGRWYDMVWMEKILGATRSAPRRWSPFPSCWSGERSRSFSGDPGSRFGPHALGPGASYGRSWS